MSDPQQPPTPDDGATPEGGPTPAPDAPGAVGASGEPVAPAPSEGGPRRRGLVVKIVAAVVVLALIGGAGAVAVFTLTGPTSHTLTLTDTAGGMERATEIESELSSQLEAAEQQFVTLAESGDNEGALDYTRVGVYQQDDEEVGPAGAMVFIGAKSAEQQEPGDYIAGVVENAENNGFETQEVAAGEDAEGVCATQDAGQVITICAWATNDTVGQLVPTVEGWSPDQLAPLMVDVRADVETTD